MTELPQIKPVTDKIFDVFVEILLKNTTGTYRKAAFICNILSLNQDQDEYNMSSSKYLGYEVGALFYTPNDGYIFGSDTNMRLPKFLRFRGYN